MGVSKIYCHCYSAMKKLDKAITRELEDPPDENENDLGSPNSNEMESCQKSTQPFDTITSTSSSPHATPRTLRTSICIQQGRHSGSSVKNHTADDLKKDLSTIKNQLLYLTRNKTEALKIAEELQRRYKKLLKKKHKQNEAIYQLKSENLGLNMIIRKITSGCASCGCGDSDDVVGVKQKLDMYEIKMNELYHECINSLKMMQDSRDKINCAIMQKSEEYRDLLECNRELREMVEKKGNKCRELEMQCCRLQKEKDSYQCHCYNLAKNIDELRSNFDETTAELVTSQDRSAEKRMLENKDEIIHELNRTIEKLQKNVENKEDLKNKYNQALSQNRELARKLQKIEERSKSGCIAAVEKIKSQQETQSKLLEEQKKLILQVDKLNSTLKEKEKFVFLLKLSNDEKDKMIQAQKEEIVDLLQKPSAQVNENNSTESQNENNSAESQSVPCTKIASSDSCLNLSKELESLVSSLYAEIDKTLVKDKIIQEQFEHNCYLKCSLSSKEAELTYVKDELKRAKNELQRIKSERAGINYDKSEMSNMSNCECEEYGYIDDGKKSEEDDWSTEEHPSDEMVYYSVRNVPN